VTSYQQRIEQELAGYDEVEQVHELPPMYEYWSARYALPLLREVGVESLDGWWDDEVAGVCRARAPAPARLVSLGAGNGDLETAMAARLAERGITNLELVLLELNPSMLERARAHAERLGFGDRVETVAVDLNTWSAPGPADVYLACHSLHHVVALEHLLDEVRATLADDGILLVNDMIGRNGHRRWPEAIGIVDGLWQALAPRYRVNRFTGTEDLDYPDHDCSSEGFEGVRAEDILRLLLERFHPATYVTFANIIDPFVDRPYGPNFDPEDPGDRAFIDAVATLDDVLLEAGRITPTHLLGSFRTGPVSCRYPRMRSPAGTVRHPEDPPFDRDRQKVAHAAADASSAEAWGRYHALRDRKVVRLGLALSSAGTRTARRLRALRSP